VTVSLNTNTDVSLISSNLVSTYLFKHGHCWTIFTQAKVHAVLVCTNGALSHQTSVTVVISRQCRDFLKSTCPIWAGRSLEFFAWTSFISLVWNDVDY